ncbi:ATP-grasp domain-containing protein [Streptomyces sp. NBC_01218]|uniref:ATP-grasp domain-containing protein n=1 Tax=unclassified Streptomyces TaxID=2593676 RepID=UPI0023B8AC2F|nr:MULTISPECIES: ATP-grasp domain-containing protein [unclassified Streptomyces]WEH39578.1 ATP-grasp domain-containing protein [Streptomyces sp. AM 2-1-1]WSQ51271.1 ATP-grasp domain-containing protein [Streptomyces sp. NBC_01218]
MTLMILHTRNASRRKHLAKAAETAHALGHRAIVVVEEPSWELEYVDAVYSAPTGNLEATVARCLEIAKEESEPISGVIAFVEHSVPAAAAVAEALGLPYISSETATKSRDKLSMREAFSSVGVSQPRFALATSVEEAQKAAETIEYPLVMKPIIGGGSMFVRRVDTPEELAEHFEEIRKGAWAGFDYDPLFFLKSRYSEGILLEEFLVGNEISVESYVQNGETVVVAVHDKPTPMDGPFFEETFYATPTVLTGETLEKVKKYTALAHQGLGITQGATHTEYRVSPAGEPYILETGARLGGGPVYQSVLLSTGIDMVEVLTKVSLGQTVDVFVNSENARHVGFSLHFGEQPGELAAVEGIDTLEADETVSEVMIYSQIGDAIDVPPRVWQAHGHVIFTGASRDDILEKQRQVNEVLRFQVR